MSTPFFTTSRMNNGCMTAPGNLSAGGAGAVASRGTVASRVPNLMLSLAQAPQLHFPLKHRFTQVQYQGRELGLYVREIRFPAGALVISKLHRTRHPWVMSSGRMSVWTEFDGIRTLTGPARGITGPGTRRIAYMHEDVVWTTYHRLDGIAGLTGNPIADVEIIEEAIIERELVDDLVQATLAAQLKEAA